MSGEVTDFKNTEYRKIRLVRRDGVHEKGNMGLITGLTKNGWYLEDEEHDTEWLRWVAEATNRTSPHDPVYILTFSRPRKKEKSAGFDGAVVALVPRILDIMEKVT